MNAVGRNRTAIAAMGLVVCCLAPLAKGRDATSVLNRDASLGWHTSMVLDFTGTPVVSFYDQAARTLKVLVCKNQGCKGKESIQAPDAAANVGKFSSIALRNGNPVVSYYDEANGDLKVLSCGDPTCSANNVITSPDTDGNTGWYTSLEIDAAGNPVVSYYDSTNDTLRLLHCGNPSCSAGNSITSPDGSLANTGIQSSLVLRNGNPVISYHDATNRTLKVLSCDDPNCAGDESANITTPDPPPANTVIGEYSSLMLDSNGYPVISYYQNAAGNQRVKVLHCGDQTCSPLATNSIQTPDTNGSAGWFTSLGLDASGFPTVSYLDIVFSQLRVLHCGDANCSTGNTVSMPDAKSGGFSTSLALDAFGSPIIIHTDTTSALKITLCDDPGCLK